MSLSNQQHQNIMREYDEIRRRNHQISAARLEQISRQIPQIRQINETMAELTTSRTRHLLYNEEGGMAGTDPAGPTYRLKMQDLSARKKALLQENGYPADYLDPIYDCPDCKDTGYVEGEKCQCFLRRMTDLLYDQSNLKSILATENFDHFRTDYYPEQMEGESISPRNHIEQLLRTSFDFIRNFDDTESRKPKERRNLLIYGNAGVGKSFLSHCIADALLRQGKSVLYFSAQKLFEVLADHTFHREREEASTNNLIFTCDLLIIDDLGTELTNAFVNSSLFVCLNERLSQGRSTIINTNLSLQQINQVYSERIFSRIMESFIPMHIIGDDIRMKIALSSLD